MVAVRGNDCPLAVRRLNAALPKRYPGVLMLAGSMFENGICVKPDWARAERMYLAAGEAGHNGALLRLVAALADGRDVAAALYWAHVSRRLTLPPVCSVPGFAVDQPEAFVQALQGWTPARRAACNYVVGVLAHPVSDIDYPVDAMAWGQGGRFNMEFVPAEGRIDWQAVERDTLSDSYGVLDGSAAAIDRAGRRNRTRLDRYLAETGKNALQRYTRPGEVPADWRIEMQFAFVINHY
jgi:hypothetical protein